MLAGQAAAAAGPITEQARVKAAQGVDVLADNLDKLTGGKYSEKIHAVAAARRPGRQAGLVGSRRHNHRGTSDCDASRPDAGHRDAQRHDVATATPADPTLATESIGDTTFATATPADPTLATESIGMPVVATPPPTRRRRRVHPADPRGGGVHPLDSPSADRPDAG